MGVSNTTTITIQGAVNSLPGSTGIEISDGTFNVAGGFNIPGTSLVVEALTTTQVSTPSVIAQSIILEMSSSDKGQNNFNKPFQVFVNSLTHPSVTFAQDWTCGSYYVNGTIQTTNGIWITFTGANISTTNTDYCCVENIDYCNCFTARGLPAPAECNTCTTWSCDVTGFIIGWVIGAILLITMLGVACTLLWVDFFSG